MVNKVPVLSNITHLTLLIYSKIVFFFTSIPDFNAKLRVIITTDGTARPNAQGHEATSIDMALSNGKHHTQYSSISTKSKPIKSTQTNNTNRAAQITPSTNFYDKDCNIAEIPKVLSSLSDYAKFNYSAI